MSNEFCVILRQCDTHHTPQHLNLNLSFKEIAMDVTSVTIIWTKTSQTPKYSPITRRGRGMYNVIYHTFFQDKYVIPWVKRFPPAGS